MLLVRRIGWQQKGPDLAQTGLMTLCKDWKVWMWLGQSRHRMRASWTRAIMAAKHYDGVWGGRRKIPMELLGRKNEIRRVIHAST